MSETPETPPPSPSNSEITLDLELEPEPVSTGGPHAKPNEPASSEPVDRIEAQPQASLEQQTFGEIVDGQPDEQPRDANGVVGRPDSTPPS